ncbi:MAG: phosphatidylglycerophosphatase A, partial [Gammaproteobacteria bacterium]
MRPDSRFMRARLSHWIALGFGSGLSPVAPGTVGTLWGWASFIVLSNWLDAVGWGWAITVALVIGWWACTRTA